MRRVFQSPPRARGAQSDEGKEMALPHRAIDLKSRVERVLSETNGVVHLEPAWGNARVAPSGPPTQTRRGPVKRGRERVHL